MEDDGKDVVVVVATDLTRCRDPEECSDEDEKSTKGKVLLETAVASKRRGRKPKRPEPAFPVEPRIIQIVNKPRTYTNHSYRDFSNVPPEDGYTHPTNVEDMTFAMKVHAILSQRDYSQCIAWCDHGRAFKILVPVRLEQSKCLGKYFGHDRYSSFLRSLSNYGFKHITQGRDRNAYYHELMLRGLPHLTKYMPEGKDARRVIPDPDNEPDFDQISRIFPLPETVNSTGNAGGVAGKKRALESSQTIEDQKRKVQALPAASDLPQFSSAKSQLPPAIGATNVTPATWTSVQAQLLALQQQQPPQLQQQQLVHAQQHPQPFFDANGALAALFCLLGNAASSGGAVGSAR